MTQHENLSAEDICLILSNNGNVKVSMMRQKLSLQVKVTQHHLISFIIPYGRNSLIRCNTFSTTYYYFFLLNSGHLYCSTNYKNV